MHGTMNVKFIGNFLPTFTGQPIGSSPLKTGPIACPETSVRNHHYSLRNNPEERSSLLRGGSLRPARVCLSPDFSALGYPLSLPGGFSQPCLFLEKFLQDIHFCLSHKKTCRAINGLCHQVTTKNVAVSTAD